MRLLPLLSLGLLLATTAATAAPVVPLSADFYRALTTTPRPQDAAALRRGLRANLVSVDGEAWDSDCEADAQASGAPPGLLRTRLPDGSWLLQVVCAQGAYQGSFWAAQLWREGGRPRVALLDWPLPKAPGRLQDDRVPSGDLELRRDGRLVLTTRFRGIGDCGTRSSYQLQRGRIDILVVAGVFACPDTPGAAGPDQWPVLQRFDR